MDASSANEQKTINLSKEMEANCKLADSDGCEKGKTVALVRANAPPKTSDAHEFVDRIRMKFLSSLEEKGAKAQKASKKSTRDDDDNDPDELYDSLDIDELKKPLPPIDEQYQSLAFRMISRFVRFDKANLSNEKVIADLAESLKQLLKFRKRFNLVHLQCEDFPKEFFVLSGVLEFGKDKRNIPMIYFRPRTHRKWSAKLNGMLEQYIAWHIDQVTKSSHNAKVKDSIDREGTLKDGSFAICFDCAGISYSCLDLDLLRFFVRILIDYYPTYCQYTLCVDLHWLFKSVFNLVKTWLPEDARNTVHLIDSKQMLDFVNEDEIPNSMIINDLKADAKSVKGKHKFPSNFDSLKSISHFAEQLSMSSSELKQFEKHVEKIRKDYEEAGAI